MSDITTLLANNLEIWTSAIERKGISGRGSSKKISLYGIDRLRTLILDLALRGKLVLQDPKDEPSSELLDRISLAESRSEPKKRFDIPNTWDWVQFGQIATFMPGRTPSRKDSRLWGGEQAWVSIADMNDGSLIEETSECVSDLASNFVFKKDPSPAGSILMSFKLTIGKISRLAIPAFHNEAIVTITPSIPELDPFLFIFLPGCARAGAARNAIKGATLNSKSIFEIPIPLPPLAEQKRIVAKVNELMALCDALEQQSEDALSAHQTLVETLLATLVNSTDVADLAKNWARLEAHFDTLFTTEASIDALKQSILELAVRGKLTGAKILQSLPIDRLFELLDGDRGKNYPKKHEYLPEGHCLFLNTKNVRRDGFLFDETQYISEEKHDQLNQGTLELGDLVITTRGTLGNISYYDGSVPYPVVRINSGMLIMRPKGTKLTQEFMMLFVQSPSFDEQMRIKRSGSAQPQIPARVLKTFMVPIFERHQQHRIVEKVAELITICDALEARLSDAAKTQRYLADAIVECATA